MEMASRQDTAKFSRGTRIIWRREELTSMRTMAVTARITVSLGKVLSVLNSSFMRRIASSFPDSNAGARVNSVAPFSSKTCEVEEAILNEVKVHSFMRQTLLTIQQEG